MIDMAKMTENEDDINNKTSAFVIGNDFTLPVMFEQLDPDYIEEVKNDPSMSPLQFAKIIGVLIRNIQNYHWAISVKSKY